MDDLENPGSNQAVLCQEIRQFYRNVTEQNYFGWLEKYREKY